MTGLLRRYDDAVVVYPDEFAGKAEADKVAVLSGLDADLLPVMGRSFGHQRKDGRYYEIVARTVQPRFEYRYIAIGAAGTVHSIMPGFLLDQDLLSGAGPKLQALAKRIRRWWPRFATLRTLMLGCAAGEGHLPLADMAARERDAAILAKNITGLARKMGASLIVLKEFPAAYRAALECFRDRGFVRLPSMPMTRLNIGSYQSFEDYLNVAIKSKRRTELRKKFKAALQLGPIELEVVDNAGAHLDEIYALYLQVFERAKLKFEKLTKEYFAEIGARMSDKARFFIWRLDGKIIAFSLCLVHGDTLYGEYIGFDYSVALKLNLYFYVMRDMISWAIENGFAAIVSTSLSYGPKLQLRHELVPLDLYVRHTSPLINPVLRLLLPRLGPTRHEEVLRQFPNYAELSA